MRLKHNISWTGPVPLVSYKIISTYIYLGPTEEAILRVCAGWASGFIFDTVRWTEIIK